MFIPGNLWSNPSYRVSFFLSCEGSRLPNGGLTLLLVSFPADSTTAICLLYKFNEYCWAVQYFITSFVPAIGREYT